MKAGWDLDEGVEGTLGLQRRLLLLLKKFGIPDCLIRNIKRQHDAPGKRKSNLQTNSMYFVREWVLVDDFGTEPIIGASIPTTATFCHGGGHHNHLRSSLQHRQQQESKGRATFRSRASYMEPHTPTMLTIGTPPSSSSPPALTLPPRT